MVVTTSVLIDSADALSYHPHDVLYRDSHLQMIIDPIIWPTNQSSSSFFYYCYNNDDDSIIANNDMIFNSNKGASYAPAPRLDVLSATCCNSSLQHVVHLIIHITTNIATDHLHLHQSPTDPTFPVRSPSSGFIKPTIYIHQQ